jgi:hypothetical protein
MVTVVAEGEMGEAFLSMALLATPTQPTIPNIPRIAPASAPALRTRAVSGRNTFVLIFIFSRSS